MIKSFKKIWQMSILEKSITALVVGTLGFLCSSWIKNAVAFGVCEGTSGLLLVLGCILFCKASWNETDWTSKLLTCGSFGAVALFVMEMVINDIALLFNIELPLVTGWYIIPCVAILLVGCIARLIKSSKTTF